MSAQTTLDGSRISDGRGGLRTGAAEILDKADPDTEWEQVANWVARARAEGVIGGIDQ